MLVKGDFKHYDKMIKYATPIKVVLDFFGYDVKIYSDDPYYEALFFKDGEIKAAEYGIEYVKEYVEDLVNNKEVYKVELNA